MRITCIFLVGLAILTTSCTTARCVKWEPRNQYVYVAGVGIVTHQTNVCTLLEEPKEQDKGE